MSKYSFRFLLSSVIFLNCFPYPSIVKAESASYQSALFKIPKKKVIAYFTQWGIYAKNYQVKKIKTTGSVNFITHINYAFGNVRNNRCEVGITQASDPSTGVGGDAYADYTRIVPASDSVDGVADTNNQPLRGNWNQLRKLKTLYPHLKVLMSLGGWTWSSGFSSAARPENRVAFVRSCINAYIKGDLPQTDNAGGAGAAAGLFDGIDIDWEYPVVCGIKCGTQEDRKNFTDLLAEFRRQLDRVHPGLLLSVAAGAGLDKIRETDPGKYSRYIDYINVMTYDFHGTWEKVTNHQAALFPSFLDPSKEDEKKYNIDDAVWAFRVRGVPPSKINIGIPFYGRGWTKVAPDNHGLYQPGVVAAGTYEAGVEDYSVLRDRPGRNYVDPFALAHWKYDGNTFWSYDDPKSISRKMKYVKDQNLGGAFFWEISQDANSELIESISKKLR